MATVSFHLKEPKSDKPTAIFIWFNPQNGQPRIRLYTGDKINPAQWTGGNVQLALTKGRNIDPETKRANEALNANNERMSKRLLAFWNDCRATDSLPTPDALRQCIEPKAAPEAPAPLPRPLPDLLAFKERQARIRRPNTIKAYLTLYNHLQCYEGRMGRFLEYADFTHEFWPDFTAYLLSLPVKGKTGQKNSSIAKLLAHIKPFLKEAVKLRRTSLEDHKEWRWANPDTDVLSLTRAELTALERVDLTTRPEAARLENARSLFLISCYTGLRFSDVAALKPEHQQGEWLRLTIEKTADRLIVPLRENRVLPLLADFWEGKIHPLSNQKLNKYIKEVAKLADINTPTEKVEHRGSRRTTTTHAKYELITTHTGRRTFVTLSLEGGLSWETIMKATGHKDFKSFRRYIQVTPERLLADFARVWGEQGATHNA